MKHIKVDNGTIASHFKNPDALWAYQKAKLSLLFPHLHADDFYYDYGKKDVMLEQLHAKLGKSRNELNLTLLGL